MNRIAGTLAVTAFALGALLGRPVRGADVAGAAGALTPEQATFFESKVRPILAANCYKCHSVEERKAKGGLTLDSRDGWHKGGKHGPAIVPGDATASLLLKAVRFEDADLQMPPNGDKLKEEEIAALEQWVKMGAPDPRRATADAASKLSGLTDEARAHWAFQPVKPQPVPTITRDAGWVKSPVDAFVLAKLQAEKMQPSRPAPREALIRRATYDLHGLPPTPEEVEAFVRDRSPDAFAKVVDRLLASPRYGERWGRYWLDTARYSDTTGAENRNTEYRYPFAWTYRDYVISSFNADKPYDLFLKEQIAADLMPEARQDPARLAALGFLTVGKRFQNPNDTIDERIDAVTKGTLALTVSCARCHDHKFDPVPTADYYSLHGIFASTIEPADKPAIGEAPAGAEYEDFKRQLAALEADSRERYYDLMKSKSAEFRGKAADYLFVATIGRNNNNAELLKLRNKAVNEKNLERDVMQGMRRVRRDDPVFAPLAAMAQLSKDEFAGSAPGVIEKIERAARRRRPVNRIVLTALAAAADAGRLRELGDVLTVYGKVFAEIDKRAAEYIERCRTATTAEVNGFDDDFVQLVNVLGPVEPAAALSFERMQQLAPQLPVRNQGGFRELRLADISELLLTHPGSPARAMVVADAPRPRNSPIFIRGEQGNRGEFVPRQFLEILSGPNRKPYVQGSGRLELAGAIASRDNPLTARVMVNRIWMHHFGQGFVRTPDDLGVQSEAPSHPELLDHLATRFVESGWSIKAMHRLVMLSSTYQQSSETKNEYAQRDPDNRLLWRANLRRLDFEAVRDSMLTFTGKLDLTLGGKPVNLTDEPYSNRRSVYGYIDRGQLPELMEQFDFADPDMANSRRTSTIVPQQALFFMNSPMAADVARKVTSRPEFLNARDDAGRVEALYAVLFQRPPRATEVRFASEFLQSAGGGTVAAAAAEEVAAPEAPAAAPPSRKGREARRAEMIRLAKQERLANIERQRAAQKMRRNAARGAIRNDGEIVERKPLTAWEQYAQALLFANEMVYVN